MVAGRTNIAPGATYTVDQPIRIGVDRFLDPITVTRQSVYLEDSAGNLLTDAIMAYDPVTLSVFIKDPGPPLAWLTAGQQYRVVLNVPSFEGGLPYGLLAIDGATLEAPVTLVFDANAAPSGPPTATHVVDFCTEVLGPIFQNNCAYSGCHVAADPSVAAIDAGHPPLGLDLSSAEGVRTTAIGQVADESNTGPLSQPSAQRSGSPFGIDMPVVTPAEPGTSWLLYKTLLAIPSSPPDGGADAGSPVSIDERTRLSDLILGQQMPYPSPVVKDPSASSANLTEAQLETLSAWIAQGAVTPAACP